MNTSYKIYDRMCRNGTDNNDVWFKCDFCKFEVCARFNHDINMYCMTGLNTEFLNDHTICAYCYIQYFERTDFNIDDYDIYYIDKISPHSLQTLCYHHVNNFTIDINDLIYYAPMIKMVNNLKIANNEHKTISLKTCKTDNIIVELNKPKFGIHNFKFTKDRTKINNDKLK